MGLILAIDASTKGCSAAVFDKEELVSSSELFSDRSSSEMLTTMIKQTVDQCKLSLSELDGIAVAKGPGSYTGLRIAVSTAKGLCYGLDKPLLSYNTLEAMTYQLPGMADHVLLCPMLDARRMEVYCAVYDSVSRKEVLPAQALIIDGFSFKKELQDQRTLFFGEGSDKCKPVFEQNRNAVFIDDIIHPSARFAGKLIDKKWEEQDLEDLAAFEPFYLKEFMVAKPKQK